MSQQRTQQDTVESWGGHYYGGPKAQGTSWPAGRSYVEFGRLKQLLARSARFHARTAVEQFVSADHDLQLQAAMATGCAMELLAKAYLATIAPAILAERGERDAVLNLSDQGHLAMAKPLAIRTIGAHEALIAVKHLLPALPYNPHSDKDVFTVRNAAAHLALVEDRPLKRAVMTCCRVVDALLPPLGLDREKFWSRNLSPVVDEMLNEALTDRRSVVAAKLAAARRRLARLIGGLDDAARTVVLASLSGRQLSSTEHEEPHVCPVCQQGGWLLCGTERGAPEVETDTQGATYPFVPITAYPFGFECAVCGLDLEGEELWEFDFPAEVALEPDYDPFEIRR